MRMSHAAALPSPVLVTHWGWKFSGTIITKRNWHWNAPSILGISQILLAWTYWGGQEHQHRTWRSTTNNAYASLEKSWGWNGSAWLAISAFSTDFFYSQTPRTEKMRYGKISGVARKYSIRQATHRNATRQELTKWRDKQSDFHWKGQGRSHTMSAMRIQFLLTTVWVSRSSLI